MLKQKRAIIISCIIGFSCPYSLHGKMLDVECFQPFIAVCKYTRTEHLPESGPLEANEISPEQIKSLGKQSPTQRITLPKNITKQFKFQRMISKCN